MKLAIFLISGALWAQQTAPIYQITVVERTVKAINYKYRSEPTMIDFRGTVLLPKAKGEAIVQSKQGRTDIEAKFENLSEPQKFGLEYLTYVLWALTPDGRPHNIGEVVPGTSDRAKLHVTTDMQAFAMIVTAEPYSAVRQPSNVVVVENAVRPDTVGKIEEVEARVELLPRGLYSWHMTDQHPNANAPKVSMREYEALSELYQAQNAIGIARTANAERYAPNTFAKAQQLLAEAQQIEAGKKDSSRVVETAREAAETAEDARVISVKHQQDETVAKAQADAAQARSAVAQAELAARKARADADAAQAQADAERAARERAEAEAAAARDRAAHAEAQITAVAPAPPLQPKQQLPDDSARKINLRMQVMEQLNSALPTRDTGRGVVATVAGSRFSGVMLSEGSLDQVGRVATILASHPELRVEVDGYTDGPDTNGLSQKRAEAVRDVLVRRGIPPSMVLARGMGNSHPIGSSRTAAGREENQRVEIIVSADAIGNIPFWDRTYSLHY